MGHDAVIAVLAGLMGLIAGGGLAFAAYRIADDGSGSERPRSRRRLAVFVAAGGGVGLWAGLADVSLLMIAATAILGWQLMLIAVVDAEHHWLPDILTWPLAISGLIATALIAQGPPWPQLIGMAAGFVMLWGLGQIYRLVRGRDGLGGGDPFLFAGAGGWVGWTGLFSVLLWACGAALVVVLARLVMRRRVEAGDRLPFGTFLAAGIWLTWLYGPIGA